MTMIANYTSDNSQRGPSQAIWSKVPILESIKDPSIGEYFYDDFKSFGGTVTTNVGSKNGDVGGYKTFETTNCTILQLNTTPGLGGVIQLLTTTNDDEEASMEAGYGNGGQFGFITGVGYPFYFEARVRLNQIVTQNFFVGMAEKGLAANDGLFSDANAYADKSILGFGILAAASASIKCVHQKNGGGGVTDKGLAQTAVAATFYKLGFVYNPKDKDGKFVRYYVNGTEVQSATSDSGATFPSTTTPGTIMTPLIVIKNSAGAACTLDLDWWRAFQLFGTGY